MSTLSSANVTDVNLVLKERTHMRLCLNMLIFTHNVGNWLIQNDSMTMGCIHCGRGLTAYTADSQFQNPHISADHLVSHAVHA